MRKTRKAFEQYLNDNIKPDYDSEEWIIGGKQRKGLYGKYGTALRKYDPIGFQVEYNYWLRDGVETK